MTTTNSTSQAAYALLKAYTLCNEVSDEGSVKKGNTSWQVGKRCNVMDKSKNNQALQKCVRKFSICESKKRQVPGIELVDDKKSVNKK